MKSYFINDAVTKGIQDYLNSKDKPEGVLYNSFLVVVIRMLINIYGELDIINPYHVRNEMAFDNNLMKYGATLEQIAEFKRLLDGFYVIECRNEKSVKKEENIYFIAVQKILIDLFILKRKNFSLTENDYKEFFDLLYTPGTSNPLRQSYNYLHTNTTNCYEVAEYYKDSLEKSTPKDNVNNEKNLLGFDVYKLFNFSVADLSKMDNKEVDKLNSEIYESFDINENALNREYLLNEKVKNFKLKREPITTGNGYVDILLVMSVIATTLMVVVIFSTLVF